MPKTDPLIPRDMAKAILQYEREATKILQAFINAIEGKKPPALLYHYTNDAGLSAPAHYVCFSPINRPKFKLIVLPQK